MKPTKLANILFKLLGVYFCLEGVPSVISGALMGLLGLFASGPGKYSTYEWTYAIGGGIQFVVGLFLVVKSRKMAEYFFKTEDE
jgi:hypothetical protein